MPVISPTLIVVVFLAMRVLVLLWSKLEVRLLHSRLGAGLEGVTFATYVKRRERFQVPEVTHQQPMLQ